MDPRPIAADDRRDGREGVRAVGSDQHAGDDGAAHPRLPRHAASSSAKDNKPPAISTQRIRLAEPAAHNYDRICRIRRRLTRTRSSKVDVRQPAAERFIVEHGLNEFLAGRARRLGIIVQGGITNVLIARARDRPCRPVEGRHPDPGAQRHASAGRRPDRRLLQGKRAVLIVEEGAARLHRAGDPRRSLRKRDIDTQALRQGRAADGRRVHRRGGDRGPAEVPRAASANDIDLAGRASASRPRARRTRRAPRRWAAPLPLGRPASASAAPSGRCSRRSSWSSAKSARSHISSRHRLSFVRDVGAVQPRAIRSWASACRLAAAAARGAGDAAAHASRSWATAASGTTACCRGVASAMFNRGDGVLVDHAERLHVGDRRAGVPVVANDGGRPARRRGEHREQSRDRGHAARRWASSG